MQEESTTMIGVPPLQPTRSYVAAQIVKMLVFCVAGYFLVSAAFGLFSSPKIDLYQVVVNRMGMQGADPKLEGLKSLGSCKIEGRQASFGLVEFSYNLLNMGGTNKRESAGKTYVIARQLANGDIEDYIASADQTEQVESIKSKWHDFWGCK